jgi:hypothetical protein
VLCAGLQGPDEAFGLYRRYTISDLRDGEATTVASRTDFHGSWLEHDTHWNPVWIPGVPFEDEHCYRVEAWEIVNGTRTSEDLCMRAEDVIGAPIRGSVVSQVVPDDALLCDASIDITAPVSADDPPVPWAPREPDSGCSQGRGSNTLPALLLAWLLLLGTRRCRRRETRH